MAYLDEIGLARVWNKVKALIPTKTSDLVNDSGFLTQHQDISGKQDTLVSGTNIKTINNISVLGSGNIDVSGGGGGGCPFPVNGIYMSMDSADPSTIWSGTTWSRVATGKTIVGVDENDADFDEAEKTGGSKYVQEHTHDFTQPTVDGGGGSDKITGGSHSHKLRYEQTAATGTAKNHIATAPSLATTSMIGDSTHKHDLPNHTHTVAGGAVGDVNDVTTGNSGNLQPFITCYIWKRTA